MKTIEKYGPDVETATEIALEEIGLPEDEVIIEILQKPKKGIGGLLGFAESVPAKVRVTEKGKGGEKIASENSDAKNIIDGVPSKIDLRKKGKLDPSMIKQDIDNKDGDHKSNYSYDKMQDLEDENREEYDGVEVKFVRDLISKTDFNLDIFGYIKDEIVEIEIKGDDAKFLIGKEGKRLDALSYLLSLISFKNDYNRIRVDIEGYSKSKTIKSVNYALKKLEKVLKTKRKETLSAMNRIERKAVHDALTDKENVKTKSEGVEPYRRITIEYIEESQ